MKVIPMHLTATNALNTRQLPYLVVVVALILSGILPLVEVSSIWNERRRARSGS